MKSLEIAGRNSDVRPTSLEQYTFGRVKNCTRSRSNRCSYRRQTVDDWSKLVRPTDSIQEIRGMTVTQARTAIAKAYVDQNIIKYATNASVVLLRKRTVNVTVLHDRQERGYGVSVKLPSDRVQAIVAMAGGVQRQSPLLLPRGIRVPRVVPTRVTIVRANRPTFTISYAQLLRNPNAYYIQPGDTIIPR